MSEQDIVDGLMQDIDRVVIDAMNNHPRSQQIAAGPSDLGDPCDVCLTKTLMGIQPSAEHDLDKDSWQAAVGTFIHAGLEGYFDADNKRDAVGDQPRWLLERRVHVGDLDDVPVWGSSDLFDTYTGTVVDWKTASPSAMEEARLRTAHTPKGRKRHYRVQAHLYGRGYARLGCDVKRVLLCYVWRDGKWLDHTGGAQAEDVRDPRKTGRFVWSEPYDEQVALDALERATNLLRAGRAAAEAGFLDEHLANLKAHYRCYDCGRAKRYMQHLVEEGVEPGDDLMNLVAETPSVDPVALARAEIASLSTRAEVVQFQAARVDAPYWNDGLLKAARERWQALTA